MPLSRRRIIARHLTGFVFAVLAVAWLPVLPSAATLVVVGVAAVVWSVYARSGLCNGVVLGFIVAAMTAQLDMQRRIASCMDGTVIELNGTVVGLPKVSLLQTQFDVTPSAIVPWPTCAGAWPARLRLSWFAAPKIQTGEFWQLRVRLRGIRGYQNPGGFDYEAWALTNHIDGGGSVRYGERRATRSTWTWDALRESLRTRLNALELTHTGIVLGLLTGDGGLMSDEDWALFRATGTVHLMVISGLHLAIAATIGVGFGRGIARCFPAPLRRRGAAWLGAIIGTLVVTLYACVAGWGVAVQRAWLATALAIWVLVLGRRRSLPLLFVWVAALVLAYDPSAPLQAGFWLSFGAVAVLLAQFAPRVGAMSLWRDLVAAQLALGCAMVPLLLATIGGVAWLGPIANLVAVPLVSVVIVPADLLAALLLVVSPHAGAWLFGVVDLLVGIVVAYLHAIATVDWSAWQVGLGRPALIVSTIACGLLLVPMPPRYRVLLVPCVLLPVVPDVRDIDGTEFRVIVLDVGQGLAVIVDTARHRLLYDAGPHPPTGLDLGRAVVLPSLRVTGTAALDLAILSHADLDHVGGFAAVASAIPIRSLLGGEPVRGATGLQACQSRQSWQWDGVRFSILHPTHAERSANDRSCVLLIDNGRRRVLLPGDISGDREPGIVPRLRGRRIDVLVAAHHGSASSSTGPFLRSIVPRLIVVSAGYMNRFGHPHPDAVCRFVAVGSRVFVTSRSGALVWYSRDAQQMREWRNVAPPYWRVGIDGGRTLSLNVPESTDLSTTRTDAPCSADAK